MKIKTRALTATGDGSLPSVREILLDPPERGDVLVEISAAAICSTERMTVDRRLAVADAPATPITVLGHSATGVVSQIGEGVTRVKPGDSVVITGTRQCGACW